METILVSCTERWGGGGVFTCTDTASLIQLQVSGLCVHELVSLLHDVHGGREEEGLMCRWVGPERRGRTRVQRGSGTGEGDLGISWRLRPGRAAVRPAPGSFSRSKTRVRGVRRLQAAG